MDDIFDEVDSILNEDNSSEEANFNESELHEIMSEIDDLEKEFEDETKESTMSLQEKIDAELSMELEELNTVEVIEPETQNTGENDFQASKAKTKVIAFEKIAPFSPSTEPSSTVNFQAHGQMSLNLDFKVGQESANLVIDPIMGLIITISGVEICINEDSGCTVEMDNGMKFTIPLSSQTNSLKKKSA